MNITVIKAPEESSPYIVIDKPAGLPSAPLSQIDTHNALYEVLSLFPEASCVNGFKEIEKGLIHRLDTVTRGLVVVACNQDVYEALWNLQKNNGIVKTYRACCYMERPVKPLDVISMESYFRNFGEGQKEVRAVFENDNSYAMKKVAKKVLYKTEIKVLSVNEAEGTCEVECSITKGYRHQVRCHLMEAGLPILNDELYGKGHKKNPGSSKIFFEATGISFEYPKGDLNSYEIAPTWT